jgi:hypothetical protein
VSFFNTHPPTQHTYQPLSTAVAPQQQSTMAHLGQHNELRLFSVLSDPHLKTLRPLRGKVLFFDHVGHRDSRGRRTRRTYIREARVSASVPFCANVVTNRVTFIQLRGATIRDTWDPDARGDIHTHYRIMGVDQIPRRKADRHPHWRYITFPSFEDFIVNCDMQAAAFIATARRVPRFLPRPRSEMVQLMMINTPESLALYKLRLKSLRFRSSYPRALGWLYFEGGGYTGLSFAWIW